MSTPEYRIRDASGDWGAFRAVTIEALAFVGKVTGEEEVCLPDGTWVGIMSVPELRSAITGEPTPVASGPAAGEPAPAEAAGPPFGEPAPSFTPAPSVAPEDPSSAAAASPAVGGPRGFEIIKTDGTMMGPLPLALMIASIRDGKVGSEDLVSKDGEPWKPAKEYPALASAIEAGIRPGAGNTGPMPAPAAAAVSAPADLDQALEELISPRAEVSEPASGEVGAVDLDSLGLDAPDPTDDSAAASLLGDALDATLDDTSDAAAAVAAAEPLPLEPEPFPGLGGELESKPFGPMIAELFRDRASGSLHVQAEPSLDIVFHGGHPIGVDLEGVSAEAFDQQALAAMDLKGDPDPRALKQARSLKALDHLLELFSRREGQCTFQEGAVDREPLFWIHPFELQRAGLVGAEIAQRTEARLASWGARYLVFPWGRETLDSMPFDELERTTMAPADGRVTIAELLAASRDEGVPDHIAQRTLLASINLGVAAASIEAGAAPVDEWDGLTLIRSDRSPDEVVSRLQAMPEAQVLGLSAEAAPEEAQTAFLNLINSLKDFEAPAEQRGAVLKRINEANDAVVNAAASQDLALEASSALLEPVAAAVDLEPIQAKGDEDDGWGASSSDDDDFGDFDSEGWDDEGAATADDSSAVPSEAGAAEEAGEGGEEPSASDAAGAASGIKASPAKKIGLKGIQQRNFDQACAHIEAGKFAQAERTLRQLVKVAPVNGTFQGYLAYCSFFLRKRDKEEDRKTVEGMERAIRLAPQDPEVRFFLGVVYTEMGDARRAEKAYQDVLKIHPTHDEALAELKGISKDRRRKKMVDAPADIRELKQTLVLFLVVFAICFGVANFVGYDPAAKEGLSRGFGDDEYYLYPEVWWFYARRAILLLFGILGVKYIIKDDQIESIRPVEFTFLGMMLGAGFGFVSFVISARVYPTDGNTGMMIVPAIGPMLGMVFFHTISEEYFFRRFISRVFQRRFVNNTMNAAFAASLLFGLYYLSYVPFFWGLPYWNPEAVLYSMPMQVLMMSVTWGLPLSLLYMWSKSMAPGLIANLIFGVGYSVLSIMRAVGKL